MTNHWIDLQHCKTILVEGSNVAENHPMAFKWIRKAQENGAILIHVDPRFTRTSAGADIYARIRPGTDAAFLDTVINYVLIQKLYDEDYVTTHTNALFLGQEDFDFKDGLFSGFDEEKHKYNTASWGYQLDGKRKPRRAARHRECSRKRWRCLQMSRRPYCEKAALARDSVLLPGFGPSVDKHGH